MRKLAILLFLAALSQTPFFISAEQGFCRKCEIMKAYNDKNPSKYQYYEDYLKAKEENGEEAVSPKAEDVPPEVRRIMDANKNK